MYKHSDFAFRVTERRFTFSSSSLLLVTLLRRIRRHVRHLLKVVYSHQPIRTHSEWPNHNIYLKHQAIISQ
jgi:hypothetical protein